MNYELEVYGRKRCWPNPRTIRALVLGIEEDHEISVSIAGAPAKIRTEHLMNTSQNIISTPTHTVKKFLPVQSALQTM